MDLSVESECLDFFNVFPLKNDHKSALVTVLTEKIQPYGTLVTFRPVLNFPKFILKNLLFEGVNFVL